ncbi:universal stress protein [Sphingobacterium psychroaquaticum]|uniref:universal stress protein n=1 Tax=Sphingobacterium psychroaquaticum TaxID=561061 RepID=UPI00106AC917|nr:universal stress protein [Sphingobacterium psychroaquaticum]QBQ40273.1 universal stress protein [Sphingobacterium psychroaquaticum]
MRKILVPVDFSEYSQVAVEYACQIIESNPEHHELDLAHVFTMRSNMFVNREVNPELVDPQVEIAKKSMKKLIEVIEIKYPTVVCHEIFKDGNLYEEISKVTAAFNYDAVIMGTKGSSGLESVFLGSNTYDVILNSKTPVLAVPKEITVFKKERIGLLCNFKPAEFEALEQAINLLGNNFELVLIHVNKNDETIAVIDERFQAWIEQIIAKTGITNISYTVKSQVLYNRTVENLSHAIDNVIIDEQIDILLVTKSRKSIFRKLVEENIVRKLAYESTIPKFFAKVHATS